MKGTATLPDGTRQAAHLDPRVGLPLAGPVPLRRAGVPAEGHDARRCISPTTIRTATRAIRIGRRSA